MNVKKLKGLYSLSRMFFHLSMLIWMCETIFFTFKYGWHWTATQPDEIFWDKIVNTGLVFSIVFFLLSLKMLLDAFINLVGDADDIEINIKKEEN